MKPLPPSELKAPGVECRNGDGVYVITSNAERTRFTLWREKDGYEKMNTADSPTALYAIIYPPQDKKGRRKIG